jgi:heat shock protein HtpX
MTALIFLNLLSMDCHMYDWFWYYLSIIVLGSIGILLVKKIVDNYIDKHVLKNSSFLSEFEEEFNAPIKIIDSQKIRAFVYNKTIFLSVGLLEILTQDEIRAVIAHEVYHLYYSPNKIISSILALSSLTFKRYKDEYLADRFAADLTGLEHLCNALEKLQIKDYKKRIAQLSV